MKPFKALMLVAILCLSFSHMQAVNYKPGDSLYVVSFSGLTMRSGPSTSSKKIAVLPSQTKVAIVETYVNHPYIDTIEGFRGHWVQIAALGETGYVFDAYLSQFPYQKLYTIGATSGGYDDHYGFNTQVLAEYAIYAIGKTGCENTYSRPKYMDDAHSLHLFPLNNGHQLVAHSYYEGNAVELELVNVRESEVYYLIQGIMNQLDTSIFKLDTERVKADIPYYEQGPISGTTFDKNMAPGNSHHVIDIFKKRRNIISIFFIFGCC